MVLGLFNKRILIARLIDFTVIGLTFFVTCSFLSINFENGLLAYLVMYSCVILVSVRLGKRLFSKIHRASSRAGETILGNATGFVMGTVVMVGLQFFIPELNLAIALIILSSVMAFFVLGTVAPLLKMERPFSS